MITLREFEITTKAALRRDGRQAWLAAVYMKFAFHSPNDMPDDPAVDEAPQINSAGDRAYVRGWMMATAERSKNGN